MNKRGQVHFLKVMANLEMKDIFNKVGSIKSALDKYRPFPDHVVKQLRDYYRINRIIIEVWGEV